MDTVVKELMAMACGEAEIRWNKISNTGYNFAVVRDETCLVVKIPFPQYFQEMGLSERAQQGQRFNQAVEVFIQRLRECGVELPGSYNLGEINGAPVHFSSDEGTDCEAYCREHPDALNEIVPLVMRAIFNVEFRGEGKVAIDPRLSNFSYQDRAIPYIDLVPPLVFLNDRHWVGYPDIADEQTHKYEVSRKYPLRGMLRLFRWDLMALDRDAEMLFRTTLDIFGEGRKREILRWLSELPDATILKASRSEKERLIDGLGPHCVDDLRDIAARLIPTIGLERKEQMRKVVELSSLSLPCNGLPEEKRELLKALLRPYF